MTPFPRLFLIKRRHADNKFPNLGTFSFQSFLSWLLLNKIENIVNIPFSRLSDFLLCSLLLFSNCLIIRVWGWTRQSHHEIISECFFFKAVILPLHNKTLADVIIYLFDKIFQPHGPNHTFINWGKVSRRWSGLFGLRAKFTVMISCFNKYPIYFWWSHYWKGNQNHLPDCPGQFQMIYL